LVRSLHWPRNLATALAFSAASADAAEKAKAARQVPRQCNDLTKALLDLEDAVNAKKPDDVKKAIAKAIDIANAAHKDYNVTPRSAKQ